MTSKYARIGRVFTMAAMGLAAIAAVSCSISHEESAPAPVSSAPVLSAPLASSPVASSPATQPTGKHWIQDQRLRAIMAELSQRNPTWPAGLPQEPESPAAATQPQQFEEIAVLANSLSAAADGLPIVGKSFHMGEADRAGFLAEARTLRDQAAALQAAANRRSIEQMQRQMDGINSTCISCHSRYRDFSGQLNTPRASLSPNANIAMWIR